ncbi:MAG TPA: hypothetical protein VFF28_01510, partial [Candidatus Nanoarchaeia archaeon]|nr:hypothetical protein [Candidatus Nanoarchaeia archaeon]
EAQVNRAINKIKNEYSRASEEERRAMMEEVRMMRDSSSATAEAQVGQEALYGSLLDMNEGLDIAQRFGATYNHEDGSFTKNGVSGWAFTKDGDIDLTVQRPATTQQKEQVQKRNQDSMIELHNSIHKDDLLTRGQDGLIYDSAGNLITELRYNHVLKDTEIKRAPPIKIIHSGKEQELTLVKDYTDDKGNPIYQTKDGTYFAQGSIWNDAQKLKPLEGSIYTIEHIGTKEKPDQVLIRVGSELNGGKKTTTGLSYSIIQDPKQAKDMAKDIPLDKDTLSLVRTSVAAGGSVKYEGDSKASSIVFKDSKGNGLKIVSFTGLEDDKDYVIAKDKMFEGSKSTQEYRLSYDKNHDGTITDEEKEEEPIRVSFAYSSEDSQNGKRTKVYAADNFKFGKDGKFTAEIVTQTFVEDKKSKTNVLSKDYSFYYIEVEESQADFKIEKKNGEPVAYDKDDQVIAQSVIKVVGNDAHYVKADGSLESIDVDSEKAKRAITAYSKKESRRWFADFQFHLTQFKGLSGWSQLIIPDEALNEWRENVDKVFSTAYLGTEYWTSAICKKHIPKENKGTFLTQTKDSLFEVVAHVEGEKTVLPQPDGKIKYLYKFTYSVRNPKNSQYKSLRFNVYLDKAIPIYRQSLDVKDGQVFSRGAGHYDKGTITYTKTEGKPVVQRSDNDYDSICIIFETGIIDASGKPKGEICNQIVEYTGSPEEYEKRITQQTIAQPTPAGPSGDPYQEMEI